MRIALVLLALLTFPAAANAASVAYIDNGEVWLSSLDGSQKVRLAATVVNGDGDTEKWLAVTQSDSGRIVAVRNKPGRIVEVHVVQGLGAGRHLDRRGPAHRSWGLARLRLPAQLRHHGRRQATWSTASRTAAGAAR